MAGKPRNIVIKVVTFALFGLLIASFAVWGIGDIFRSPQQVRAVAEVGDVQITRQEFSRTLSRELNRLSARFGGRLDMEQARALGLVDQVLGQMIGRALFEQKADDLGLIVSDEQVLRRIQSEPAFHNELGEFDRNRFVQTLQISNLSEQEYVESLRRDVVRQHIAGAVIDAVTAPRGLAEALYRYRAERRVAKVMVVRNDSIEDIPEPDQAALETYHEEFADRFMAPEYRAVSFVHLRAEDLADEVVVSDEEVQEEFAARKEDYAEPERRVIEQIVLLEEDEAREAEDRLAAGEDFDAVAQELTGTPPVDIGAVEHGELPGELADAAFALPPDVPSEPIESPLGWHIMRVTDIEAASQPTLEEVRDELVRDIAMRIAVDSMVSIANQLDDELAGGASLEEAAGRLDLELRRVEAITRRGLDRAGEPVPDLPPERFLETAFGTPAGEESLVTETSDGGYFILRVDGVTPEQLRPLEAVREDVAELWREAQRANRAQEKAEALADRLRQGQEMEAVAAEEGLNVLTTDPLTRSESDPARAIAPSLPSKLFQVTTGEVVTAGAPAGYVVAELVEVQPANPAGNHAEVEEVAESLADGMRADMFEQFMAGLRRGYGVEVNQVMLEDLLATF